MTYGHIRQALATWEQLQKIDPGDRDAPVYIGSLLVAEGEFAAALPELEKAARSDPTNAGVFWRLGYAELQENEPEKALAAYERAVQLEPSAKTLNSIAAALADANVHLHTAQAYAARAVKQVEDSTKNVSLDSLGTEDLMNVTKMGMAWDTLGWADLRLGQLAAAKSYLLASWQILQFPSAAYHLALLYEKEGKPAEARRYYGYALADWRLNTPAFGFRSDKEAAKVFDFGRRRAMRRLTALLGSSSRANEAVRDAGSALSRMRTIRVPKIKGWLGTTQVMLLVGAPSKVLAIKRVGAGKIPQQAVKDLLAINPGMIFPDDNGEKIVRRAVLDCKQVMPSCDLILMTPDAALGMN